MAGVELFGDLGIFNGNLGATIDERMHENSPKLGEELKALVQEKTPVRKDALRQDIDDEAFPDPGDSELVWIFAGTENQEAAWHRVYVQYQEGEPLGRHTYTNPPRQMFLQTAEGDGVDMAELWGEEAVQEAIDLWIGGAGVP